MKHHLSAIAFHKSRPVWRNTLGVAGAALACAALLLASPALAQDSQQLYVKSLAATCANCHGTNGKSAQGSAVPALAGLPQDYIVAAMKAFKSGARTATIMHQLSKGYTDAQIEQIAAYFAAQKK